MLRLTRCLTIISTLIGAISCHTIITYPGYRGNNLHTNGTAEETRTLGTRIPGTEDPLFPYGMQWTFPCGGLPVSRNRTTWPINGGAISMQPGWFTGHSRAQMYINIGFGTIPERMETPLKSVFEILGPTNNPYPGTICLKHVPMPPDTGAKVGDNATIQVIMTAQHGASLYDCIDITFREEDEVPKPTPEQCFNSSTIGFGFVRTVELGKGD